MTKNLTTRPPIIRAFLGDEIVADNFAGGGGASSGMARAIGRSPDIAINHCEEAIAMHEANHPETTHYRESVWKVDPVKACGGKPVAFAWFSPTCGFFSKARGGPLSPEAVKQRALAWVAVRWAVRVRPRIIALENVEEFQHWGPLHRKHTAGCYLMGHTRGCKGKHEKKGKCKKGCGHGRCRLARCQFCQPIKKRKGETFRRFVRELEDLGYVVEWRLLRACDYGAPTSRRRLFLVARCDGQPIAWPEPTHGPGRGLPYRTAAECIDWDDLGSSIFERGDRPLKPKTLARIARGVRKFVLESAKPFVIPVNHAGYTADGDPRADHRVHDIDGQFPTITGQKRGGHAVVAPVLTRYNGERRDGETRGARVDDPLSTVDTSNRHALAVPYLVHRSNGERPEKVKPDGTIAAAQEPRIYDPQTPLTTIVAEGLKHAACVALLIKHNGGNNDAAGSSGQRVDAPIDTIACRDQKSLAVAEAVSVAHLAKFYGTSTGAPADVPTPTILTGGGKGGGKLAQVVTFLQRYNGKSTGQQADAPLGTLDTTDRYGLVTVWIDGEEYVLVDIRMRMLKPRELFRAQGFDESYQIAPMHNGKELSKTAQIRMVGNSVPPDLAEAITRANLGLA